MQADRVVLDTNSLLVSISRRGSAYPVWQGFQEGQYTLCVSTEILLEYEEMIAKMTRPEVASNVIELILNQPNVERIEPTFRLGLIEADPDDNKFIDCAFAANATFIVSDDTHLDVLQNLDYPKLVVMKLMAFVDRLLEQK